MLPGAGALDEYAKKNKVKKKKMMIDFTSELSTTH